MYALHFTHPGPSFLQDTLTKTTNQQLPGFLSLWWALLMNCQAWLLDPFILISIAAHILLWLRGEPHSCHSRPKSSTQLLLGLAVQTAVGIGGTRHFGFTAFLVRLDC